MSISYPMKETGEAEDVTHKDDNLYVSEGVIYCY